MKSSQTSTLNQRNISASALILCLALYTLLQCVTFWLGVINGSVQKPKSLQTVAQASSDLAYTSRYLRINEYLFTGVDSKTYVA